MSREVAGTGGTEGGILLWFEMRKGGRSGTGRLTRCGRGRERYV
jgi:hypothetical protein